MPPPSAENRREGVLMPGTASRAELDTLRGARGKRADEVFLWLMIAHHRGGVHMARAVAGHGAPVAVERLARTMVAGQQAEIALMESLLKASGGGPW
ncbi:hypothetical protein CG723_41720 [Streptomyces sp. CB01635]|uniref:DUF305 domain-containing protein n=1 Tax=unclassified Streptomyces TaxID=2593676 RepID=UPI000C27BE5E|nr:DUF305 domain-containing protein [Streptomyces sp. CB01635]PJN05968.1 hypothetical protein CG723_41720 [Streptomyces sp. CB01635]